MENMQQHGPSESGDNNGFVTRDEFREGMNALQADLREIALRLGGESRRGVPLQQTPRIHRLDSREGGNSMVGGGLRPTGHVTSFTGLLDEPRTNKHLARVSSLIPPGGKIWSGLSDKRSARRFLVEVGNISVENGLDAEGLIHFILNKCISPELARELALECEDLYKERPLDHVRIAERMGESFNTKYRFTNSSDRIMDYLDGGSWAKEARDLDHYLSILRGIFRDCELVDIRLDDRMKRRHLLRWLPRELREYAEERLVESSTVESLADLMMDWVARKNQNYFKPGVSRNVPIKVASTDINPEGSPYDSEPTDIGIAAALKGRGDCLLCGKSDHYVRDCPSLNQARESLRKNEKPATSVKEPPNKLNWANTFHLVGASHIGQSLSVPFMKVSVQGLSGSYCQEIDGLLDTGAVCSLLSKRLAERLYEERVLGFDDIHGVRELTFTFADGSSRGEIGHCWVKINGVKTKVYVLPDSTPDLILGTDFITSHPEAISCLIQKFRGTSEPLTIASSRTTSPQVLADTSDMKGNIADWPLIHLPWKSPSRPNRVFDQVHTDALNLERRLKRNGLVDMYSQVIETWVSNGWLQEVNSKTVRNFLTHFEVVKKSPGPNATMMQKCRVVVNGSKLKEFLNAGTCSTDHDLMANLLLWRMAERYIVVDISNAYLRLGVHPDDRIYLGICWKEKSYVFASLPMGIQPSASFLQACVDAFLAEWIQSIPPHENEQTVVAPYMDDLMSLVFTSIPGSVPADREEELKLSLLRFLEGKNLPASREKTAQTGQSTKYLGVKVENDRIRVRPKIAPVSPEEMTRRKAASVLASCFDPLGLSIELNMKGRILLSEMGGGPWKQVLPRSIAARVNEWVQEVNNLQIDAPRRLLCDQTLLIFCDASQLGWGVVVLAPDRDGKWNRLYAKGSTLKAHQKPWGSTSSKIELLALHSATQVIQLLVKLFDTLATFTIILRSASSV
jgi:hypothetical protein